MIEIEGKRHPTIADASGKLKVSVKTINQWIERAIIDHPPTITQGLRLIRTFPPEYIEKAREQIQAYRNKKSSAKAGSKPK
jgi:hypothetical protein